MRDSRNAIIALFLMACILVMLMTILASADGVFNVSGRSALLYEPKTETFIYSKNIDEKLPMASTTKIMTGLLATELLMPDEIITVPKEAVGIEGSSVYLSEGDTLTVRDLVYSLLLQSANDAAEMLAIRMGGDIYGFAEIMNRRAAELGLSNTHFDNPHGLDSETHYTTARDLALLTAEALKNESFRKIVSTYKYSFMLSGKPRTVVNHNKLLKSYDGAVGVKTGYTKRSGRCLVSAAERDGLTLISVSLDAPDDWRDHKKMLDLGFSTYERIKVSDIVPPEYSIPVISGTSDTVNAKIENADGIYLIKKKSDPDIVAVKNIRMYVAAPVKCGDELGEVIFTAGGREICRAKVIATQNIAETKKKFNFFDIFKS